MAARHTQYERFYAGPQFVHAIYNFNNCPSDERRAAVDAMMAAMTVPEWPEELEPAAE